MSLTINEWIESGKNLPVLSSSITKLMSLTQDSESKISQIADIIKKDVGLSAAILRITNSSAFGRLRSITSIDQAVVLLGFNSVRNIALAVGIVDSFSPSEDTFLSKIWQRSILTGIAACELCSLSDDINHDDTFTNSLLHDIGLIALYVYDNELVSQLIIKMETSGRASLAEESDIFGIDHTEVGRLLAEKWELPDGIKISILQHHDEPAMESHNSKKEKLSCIYYLSSLIGDIFYYGKKDESLKNFMNLSKELIGIDGDKAEKLLQDLHPQLVEIASYFNIEIGSGKTYEQILCEANEEIMNITISNEATKYHLQNAFNREKDLAKKLEEKNRDLKMLASKDNLTGLYNRQFLNEIMEKEWHRSERHFHPLSISMVDIDDFKKVNDIYGHIAGDSVLVKIAEVFKQHLRKNDFVVRYGGEEFVFVFPETDLKDARKITNIINRIVRKLDFSFIGEEVNPLSISCGVSTAFPFEAIDSVDALLKRADEALYDAKKSGKNRVAIRDK